MDANTLDAIKKSMISIVDLHNEDFSEALMNLSQRFIPLKETGVSSRTFLHWKANKLIDYNSDERRVSLNAFEFLWVKCLSKMRDFGLPLNVIKKATESVNKNMLESYFDMRKEYGDQFKKLFMYSNSKEEADQIIEYTDSGQLSQEIEKIGLKMSFFNMAVLVCLINKERVDMFVYDDTDTLLLFESTPDIIKTNCGDNSLIYLDILESKPHLKININHLISEFLEVENFKNFLTKQKIFSQQELMVLRLLKDNQISQIIITKEQADKVYNICTIKYEKPTVDECKTIRETLNLRKYESITVLTNSNDEISIKRSKTKKIS